MMQNDEIIKLENILVHLGCLREDLKYVTSRIDDTILDVRQMVSELQIKGEEEE